LRIDLHTEAIRDLDEAVAWYEARQPGLGAVFLREVSRAFEIIGENPRMWSVWPGWRSRTKVRRFVCSASLSRSLILRSVNAC
jgi:plasmid stabilization system protein ParE